MYLVRTIMWPDSLQSSKSLFLLALPAQVALVESNSLSDELSIIYWRLLNNLVYSINSNATILEFCRSGSFADHVLIPSFRVDAQLENEQVVGINLLLDSEKAGIVVAPVCLLRVLLKNIGLQYTPGLVLEHSTSVRD